MKILLPPIFGLLACMQHPRPVEPQGLMLGRWLMVCSGIFCPRPSVLGPLMSPVDGAARERALFSWLKVAVVTDGMRASVFR